MGTTQSKEYIIVGKLLKPFGLKGEIKVQPDTDDLSRHTSLKKVYLQKGDGDVFSLTVDASRLHLGQWYLKFGGLKTPEAVKPYSHHLLLIPKEERIPISKDKIYISDILEFDAIDEHGEAIGKVIRVDELPGQDLIIVRSKTGKDSMIPWIPTFVKNIDEENQKIHIEFDVLRNL